MKRIVVKIGSQVLCDDIGLLNTEVLAGLVKQVATLHRDGWQVLLVSSGAVAAGLGEIGADNLRSSDPVTRKQVLASIGQVRLMQTYRKQFKKHGLTVAQVLASKSDFQTRNHYLNMRNCIEGILDAGIVPVVNENDVVSITELMFTDNDELAGLLAGMVNAKLLCMLSNVEGVFAQQDQAGPAKVIQYWNDESHKIEDIVSSGTSTLGRGGMHSKLSVARKTAKLGTAVVIAAGKAETVLLRIANNENTGTRYPAGNKASPAKRWLASADDHVLGTVQINVGAALALSDKTRLASLLLVGVESLDGNFSRGDEIRITDTSGNVLGVGRAQYDCSEARNLLGRKDIRPLIHYDYLYLTD